MIILITYFVKHATIKVIVYNVLMMLQFVLHANQEILTNIWIKLMELVFVIVKMVNHFNNTKVLKILINIRL